MNRKKSGLLYLIICVLSIGISFLLIYLYSAYDFDLDMVSNMLLSEAILILPAILMLCFSKEKVTEVLSIRKIKLTTLCGVVAFTIATSPLITLVNLISQLWVSNRVYESSTQFLSLPPFLLIFFVGILAPVCEEVVFRGAILGGYKKEGNVFKAVMLSGILFGLMHMNINQASYALVIGIFLGFLVEATGSLFSSIIFHMLINSGNVILMIVSDSVVNDEMMEQAGEIINTATLLNMMGIYVVPAVIGTVIAICLLVWMSNNEGRSEIFKKAWDDRKKKSGKVISVSLIAGVIISILYMILVEFI